MELSREIEFRTAELPRWKPRVVFARCDLLPPIEPWQDTVKRARRINRLMRRLEKIERQADEHWARLLFQTL